MEPPSHRQHQQQERLPDPEVGSKLEKEALDLINEFFYGVRIFPGQDPNLVYIGWVTTQYHIHSLDFSQDIVRTVTIQQLDSHNRINQRYVMRVISEAHGS